MREQVEKCLSCGGEIEVDRRTGKPTCTYCGREYASDVKSFTPELKEIARLRQLREFIQAEERCKILLQELPECAEAYWQMLLVSLGVVFVRDEADKKVKPTFFSYSYDERISVLKNEFYLRALKYAEGEDRGFYEEKVKEIDGLLREFFSLVAKEDSYDIFISFKQTETAVTREGQRITFETDDCRKAREIYEALSKVYKVFFSPVSIGKDSGIEGEKYEPRILKALQTAQAMVLIGSKKEYLEAQWVENEWKRYLYFIQKEKKKKNSLIFCYLRQMPSLPGALAEIQLPTCDAFRDGYRKELEDKLSRIVTPKGYKTQMRERKVQTDFEEDEQFNFGYNIERVTIAHKGREAIVQIAPTEARDLESANEVLRRGGFGPAAERFSSILRKNPHNAAAYMGRFCARIKASSLKTLPYYLVPRVKEEHFVDFENAIANAPNDEYFGSVIDAFVDGLKECLNRNGKPGKYVKKIETVLDHLQKYLDEERVKKVLEVLGGFCRESLAAKDIKLCERFFVRARNLFFEENRAFNIDFMLWYAINLYTYGYYIEAQRYFEEVALVKRSAEAYWYLLASRLKTPDLLRTKFNLMPDPTDDASAKKPSELDLDEIVERVILCELKEPDPEKRFPYTKKIFQVIKYQIEKNSAKEVTPFVETVVSCFTQFKQDRLRDGFLFFVAYTYLQLKKFKLAELYYREILAINPENSRAHWGLLFCRLNVTDEAGVIKRHKELAMYQEFNNATSCADKEEYRHDTAIAERAAMDRAKTVDREELRFILEPDGFFPAVAAKETRERKKEKREKEEEHEKKERKPFNTVWVAFSYLLLVLVALFLLLYYKVEQNVCLIVAGGAVVVYLATFNRFLKTGQNCVANGGWRFGLCGIVVAITVAVSLCVSNDFDALIPRMQEIRLLYEKGAVGESFYTEVLRNAKIFYFGWISLTALATIVLIAMANKNRLGESGSAFFFVLLFALIVLLLPLCADLVLTILTNIENQSIIGRGIFETIFIFLVSAVILLAAQGLIGGLLCIVVFEKTSTEKRDIISD